MSDPRKAAIAAVHCEGVGLVGLTIVQHDAFPRLVEQAEAGMPGTVAIYHAVAAHLDAILNSANPPGCVACRAPLGHGRFALVAVHAGDEQPVTAFGMAVCQTCGPDPAGITEKATEALRAVWPDATPVQLTDRIGGRA